MKKAFKFFLIPAFALAAVFAVSCNKENPAPEAGIVSFTLLASANSQFSQDYSASVGNGSIDFRNLPSGTDVSALVFSFTTKNEDDAVSVAGKPLVSGQSAVDCSQAVTVVVTNVDGKAVNYTLTVSSDPYPQPKLLTFAVKVEDNAGVLFADAEGSIKDDQVSISFPAAADISAVVPSFTTNPGDVVYLGSKDGEVVESGVTELDFTDPVNLYLVNGDGKLNAVYVVTAGRTAIAWAEVANYTADTLYSGQVLKINPATQVPYVVYKIRQDKTNADRVNTLAMVKYEDGAVSKVGGSNFGKAVNGSNYHFDISASGVPYVAFADDKASPKGTCVMKSDGSGWSYVGDPDGAPMLSIQAQKHRVSVFGDKVFVAQYSNTAVAPYVKRGFAWSEYSDGAWTSNTHPLVGGTTTNIFDVTNDGTNLYLITENAGKVGDVNYGHSVYSFSEKDGWKALRENYVAETASQTGITCLVVRVAPDGTPYILTSDNAVSAGGSDYNIRVEKYNGEAFVTVGGATIPYVLKSHNSATLAVAPDGTPFVVYFDETDGYKLNVVSINPETLQWTAPVVVAEDTTMSDLNIAFTSTGKGYITYCSSKNELRIIEGK